MWRITAWCCCAKVILTLIYLTRALGRRCDMSACFGAVFVSTMFWKNFFKYNHFACRLQGLDAGVLMGQVLETAKRFAFTTAVYFQFLDVAINHLLGLAEQEETVYAVIPLSLEPALAWFATGSGVGTVSAAELCRELDELHHSHYVRSRRVLEYPMLLRMHEASRLDTTEAFRQIKREKHMNWDGPTVALPAVPRLSYDLASVCKKRCSPGLDFVLSKVDKTQLAMLLHEATASFSYLNDLDGTQERPEPRVSLCGCLYGVEAIPDGAYHYDSAAHVLRQICPGDHRFRLQQGMSMHNVNLFQVPLCLHVAGDRDHLRTELGYRGYRIQQMEAGMLVQRVLFAASAIGMGGHPLLGFDVSACDELYQMAANGQTSLIQVPVGSFRPGIRLAGSLHG